MNLWKSLSGMMEMELTSACVEAALDAISEADIPVFQVRMKGDLTVRFLIYRKHNAALCSLCEKRGEKLRLIQKKGLYWEAGHIVKRPILAAAVLGLALSALIIPRYVFFVQIDGNHTVPANRILEAASECGIRFGASRKEVRSEHIKNALLSKVPELQWAGVNTRGCVAVISVRERASTQLTEEKHMVSSVVADRDGVITSCTATRGNLMCAPGQAVKEGELLISGYTDCGISIQATQAEGEVFAQTIRDVQAVFPRNWTARGSEIDRSYDISLLIGKKRINLWKDSGIWDASCGRMYQEYYVTLPGGFSLPVALCVDTFFSSELNPLVMPQQDVEPIFCEFAERSLLQQTVAGEILDREDVVTEEEARYVLQGSYVCTEMIGRVKPEKMGEYYGKTD